MLIEGLEVQYNSETGEKRFPDIETILGKINRIISWINSHEASTIPEQYEEGKKVIVAQHKKQAAEKELEEAIEVLLQGANGLVHRHPNLNRLQQAQAKWKELKND